MSYPKWELDAKSRAFIKKIKARKPVEPTHLKIEATTRFFLGDKIVEVPNEVLRLAGWVKL